MKKFKVVKCPHCGFVEITTASKNARCFGCGRAWQIKPEDVLFSSGDPERAREFLRGLKRGGGVGFKRASEKFVKEE